MSRLVVHVEGQTWIPFQRGHFFSTRTIKDSFCTTPISIIEGSIMVFFDGRYCEAGTNESTFKELLVGIAIAVNEGDAEDVAAKPSVGVTVVGSVGNFPKCIVLGFVFKSFLVVKEDEDNVPLIPIVQDTQHLMHLFFFCLRAPAIRELNDRPLAVSTLISDPFVIRCSF
ncbi:hypothetical protein BC830DRAFT_959847 [Chytriomyces sp. MP71]|nr:hypothetical protein BC830DRAFT_959847 [Chytriomyces sp. MP71]